MNGQIDPRLAQTGSLDNINPNPNPQQQFLAQKPPPPLQQAPQQPSHAHHNPPPQYNLPYPPNGPHSSPHPHPYYFPQQQQQQQVHTPQQQHAGPTTQPSPTTHVTYQIPDHQQQQHAHVHAHGPPGPQHEHEQPSPGDYSQQQQSGHDDPDNPDDPKRPRACEACRGLKVRCDQDPAHPDIPCKRCAKANRACIITQPSRKRQKKADSRVAELEKKLDALTAVLQQQQHHGPPPPQQGGAIIGAQEMMRGRSSVEFSSPPMTRPPDIINGLQHQHQNPLKRRRLTEDTAPPSIASVAASIKDDKAIVNEFRDLDNSWGPNIDMKRFLHHTTPEEWNMSINSLITPEVAAQVFERYVKVLSPHLPAVVFPPGTTAEQMFKERPILYVCILSAASFGAVHPDVNKQLSREAIGAIADCVVRNGAKSLELVQAMQVTALWYRPPENAEQTNFYQIIHMAAVMALDIGLGKRFNPAKARRGLGGANGSLMPGPPRTSPQDSDTLEARRAWLTSYYLCASASMVLRRPNLVRWTNYMRECLDVLSTHPSAFPSDKLFCQHVRIQHICEDIGLQFLMDDNTATISITDPKVSYALNVLENQLRIWKENIPPEVRGPGLQFFEHVTSLYLHEIALHFNHNIEDFRVPFTEESLKTVNNTSDTLTQNQMAALEACLRAAHGILDTMLAYPAEVIKALPMLLFFVRCVYAVVILIKMHVAVCTPGSELGKMMAPADLRVEYYVEGLIELFGDVGAEGEGGWIRPHPKILRILGVIREWFGKHKENVAAGVAEGGSNGNGGVKSEEGTTASTTPLQVLSRVAQLQQQPLDPNLAPPPPPSWTYPPMDWNQPKQPARLPSYPQQQQQQQQFQQQQSHQHQQQQQMLVDPTGASNEYSWGSGFEQAMDIALGGMDGLQQEGALDGWFLGDGMAPFGGGFLGDERGGVGGW